MPRSEEIMNHIHCTYIFCVVVSWQGFCTQSYQTWIIFKQIYLIHRGDPNRHYHTRSEWAWLGEMALKVYSTLVLSKEASNTIFLSLWYVLNWDWTLVSQAIGKHSNHYTNRLVTRILSFWMEYYSILGSIPGCHTKDSKNGTWCLLV